MVSRRARARAAGHRAALLRRPGARDPHAPGLGDPALRSVLAAPGHRLGAARDAGAPAGAAPRHTAADHRQPAHAPAARGLRERAQLRARARRDPGRSNRSASAWWRPAMPASARSADRASSRCAVRCSTCGRWAPTRRCASTCSTIRSTRSAASIRRRSARMRRSNRCRLLPARELPLDAEAVREFRRRFRLRFSGDVARLSVYRGVSEGLAPPGIEFYLPLFFEHTASLARLPARRPGVRHRSGTRRTALAAAWDAISARHEQYRHDIERPLLAPEETIRAGRRTRVATGAARARVPRALRAGGRRIGRAAPPTASLRPRNFQLDARATEPLAALARVSRRLRRAACCWRPIRPDGAR